MRSIIKSVVFVAMASISFYVCAVFAAGVITVGTSAAGGAGGGSSLTGVTSTGLGPWNICNFSVIPTSGAIPLTVRLNGTTRGSISMTGPTTSAINTINRGDGSFSGGVTGAWVSRTSARVRAVHTYTTAGIFPISDYVTYYVDTGFRWLDANASALCVFNSIVATGVNAKGPVCGNGIVEGTEACDDGVNNGLPGDSCSTSCTLVTPKCSITVTPTSGSAPLPVVVTVSGFGGILNSISWGDMTSTFGPWTGTLAGLFFSTGHTYLASGTYTINATMYNSYSPNYSSMCSATVIVMGPIKKSGPVCGNGVVEGAEQCDDGANNGIAGYGCDTSCKLTLPKCIVSATPSTGFDPLPVMMNVTGFGGVISSIYWGEGPIIPGRFTGTAITGMTTSFSTGLYTYVSAGTYGIVVQIRNPHVMGLANMCTTSVTAEDIGFMPRTGSGTTSTGAGTKIINPTTIKPVPSTIKPVSTAPTTSTYSPDLMKNIIQWAYKYGITSLPLSQTQALSPATRYSVAQMFVLFATRVKKQTIIHNPVCAIEKFSDYRTFASSMKSTITQICDLGLMGRGADATSLIGAFDPSGAITASQLKVIVNRYLPGLISSGTTIQNRNVDVLYWLGHIAAGK